ncbi:MAG TPA: hypothetical protein VGW38_19495 [Chloroflexota bacterium]|nr:hypothetical protein [Chloroflexota bacterium]
MVALNPQTNVITRSIRHEFAGTKPGTCWTVQVDPVDGAMICDCPDATYRNRQCKHQRAVIAGTAPKPVVRVTQRPPLRHRVSEAGARYAAAMEV